MAYVLTPLAKADIFDIWSYIADDRRRRRPRRTSDLRRLRACCRSAHARPFPSRPHNPFAAFLDADPLPQLHRCVTARDVPTSGCRRSAREKKCTAHPETAPLKAYPPGDRRANLIVERAFATYELIVAYRTLLDIAVRHMELAHKNPAIVAGYGGSLPVAVFVAVADSRNVSAFQCKGQQPAAQR